MPNNQDIIAQIEIAGFTNASVSGEVIREIDLGEYSEKLGGSKMFVCVNPSHFITKLLWLDDDKVTRDIALSVISAMANIPKAALERWSDSLVTILYYRIRSLYWEYDADEEKLDGALAAHFNPINAGSEAFKDGRSSAPALPAEFDDIMLTRNINLYLGSNYTIEQIRQMRSDDMVRLQMLIRYAR